MTASYPLTFQTTPFAAREPAEISVTPKLAWFALQVHANYERRVADLLAEKGYACYVPLLQCRRQWSDRVKEICLPLFSGYVFCEFDVEKRLPVLVTPRVRSVVGAGKQPLPIPEEELVMVRKVVGSGMLTGPHPYLNAGQRVLIERGPLAGVKGTLIDVKGAARVVVSIDLLQRSIAAEVDVEWVRPIV